MINNLGEKLNLEVILDRIDLGEKTVADIGCGNLSFTRQIAPHCKHVIAIDPDPVQAEKIRSATDLGNIEFHQAGAEKLPLPDNSVDGVFFAYSLHHVPTELYPQTFTELDRLTRPGGFLYVIEPTDSPLNEVMKLFHDESEVRAAAQQALHELAMPNFAKKAEFTYHGFRQYKSFDDFAETFVAKSFNHLYTEEDVRDPKVQQLFEENGAPEYRFTVPKIVMHLSEKKG